jgi:DNA ligase D-like protein (predicted 3'-phosphoesterase)
MALDEYRAKRDFSRSPEPAGDSRRGAAAGPRFFCVQKHLASHLHYDFRLEHDGVLLSWAVPKGPAVDPSVKRLAMHVEDHPVEYGTFEGVIPEGYGAGIVMLWDRGTWMPEVDDVGAALRKGDLKFRLDGVKLKGSWALVRTRGAGERSWLLLKHRDEWSGPLDIAEFAPLSVKSGGDFADILAEGNPDVWRSHRPAKGGDAGAMFERIVARALALREERQTQDQGTRSDESSNATPSSKRSSAEGAPVEGSSKGPTARSSVAKTSSGDPRADRAGGRKSSAPASARARKGPKAAARRAPSAARPAKPATRPRTKR